MYLYDELCELEREGKRIRVGLVGAGFMGRGIVEVVEACPGMEVCAVCDIDIDRALSVFEEAGETSAVRVKSLEEGRKAAARRIVTASPRIITGLDSIDMVLEATGNPETGAEVAYLSIMNKKHVGMLNVETDVTVGPLLSRLAGSVGVVYTVCAGDEPAAVKELCDFAHMAGLSVVACGKGKNNPLDVCATPDSLSDAAHAKGLNPKILTEFVDGTKTMVEMSCVANATGLTIDTRNMHGPVTTRDKLSQVFSLRKDGGILSREGVVDYMVGDLAPGVFAVVRPNGTIQDHMLKYLKIGEGPNYLLYRPYHLTSLEVADSIAWACLYGKPTIAGSGMLRTEVTAVAKTNLKKGDFIDGIGGFSVRGGIERFDAASKQSLLPLGLAAGARLKRDVENGEALTLGTVEIRDSLLLYLRKIQDRTNG